MSITSSAFENKRLIPSKYTCDGLNVNPPLDFLNVPKNAESLTLIVEDPDAPGKTWMHWAVFNMDPSTSYVRENSIPGRGRQVFTDFGQIGYGGPCPPNGPHRYNFKLYALDKMLTVTEDITLPELESAMRGHVIEKAEITGIYSRE